MGDVTTNDELASVCFSNYCKLVWNTNIAVLLKALSMIFLIPVILFP